MDGVEREDTGAPTSDASFDLRRFCVIEQLQLVNHRRPKPKSPLHNFTNDSDHTCKLYVGEVRGCG